MRSRSQTVVLALVLLVPLSSAAQPATTSGSEVESSDEGVPLANSLTGDALRAYESARLLFDDGDPAGALQKFKRSYQLAKDPRLLWNMAVCEKELRNYGNAARLVARYLKEGQGKISARARERAEATRDALKRFYSEVKLVGVPAGARVSVDGVEVGLTPFREPFILDLGARTVRVEVSGYEAFEQQVEVPGAQPVELRVQLVRKQALAGLSITTDPDAVISVDGQVVGSGGYQTKLPAGDHSIRVTAPGKQPYEAQIQLEAGASRSLQVALKQESTLWPWLAGGGALLVGAGVGAYLLLKPDPEPGSVPRGELGTVYLPLLRY